MGKVLSSFTNGFPGAIARSLDDVVISLANKSEDPIAFGMPVALNEDKNGIVPFDGSEHTASDFVGVAVRNPSKTPDTYGDNQGSYASDDLVDVLVRGHIVVKLAGTSASLGDQVSIVKSTGGFAVGTGDSLIPLPNAHVSATPDASGMAEIVLNTRNLV
ncbi:MAG: hypothetical protein IJ153_04390 [Clostridia bacterium]|nr:hypothetical protein [Clostridia bacterium]